MQAATTIDWEDESTPGAVQVGPLTHDSLKEAPPGQPRFCSRFARATQRHSEWLGGLGGPGWGGSGPAAGPGGGRWGAGAHGGFIRTVRFNLLLHLSLLSSSHPLESSHPLGQHA